MIAAYRTIEVPVELEDRIVDIKVPLTIDLLQHLEQTIEEAGKYQGWFRIGQWFKRRGMIDVFKDFADPYLPPEIVKSKVQPAFYSIFFSLVRKALVSSLNESILSTTSTDESPPPTAEKTAEV
jgi:hypothetical protein